jgi:hypothetical protein
MGALLTIKHSWRNSMIRFAALAGVLAALTGSNAAAQNALPTVTYKLLPAAMASKALAVS